MRVENIILKEVKIQRSIYYGCIHLPIFFNLCSEDIVSKALDDRNTFNEYNCYVCYERRKISNIISYYPVENPKKDIRLKKANLMSKEP